MIAVGISTIFRRLVEMSRWRTMEVREEQLLSVCPYTTRKQMYDVDAFSRQLLYVPHHTLTRNLSIQIRITTWLPKTRF